MANKIQIRRDSAANWAAFNPILADGELGIDTTNGYMKFGDGLSPWNDCQYVRFPGSSEPGQAPANTAVPTVSGTAQVGQTLTSTTGTWTGSPTPTYSRQWLRSGVAIAGATAASYVPTTDDIGATIALRVTATNSEGSATATSLATAAVIAAGSGNVAPSNNSVPTISGTAQVGQTLSSTTGSWSGTPTPTYARQWLRDGVAISGATGSTYSPVTGDIGAVISLRVTATNSEGSAQATSAATSAVVAAPADSRARFGYGAANANPADILASSTVYGAANASKAGTFNISPPSGQYAWFFIEAAVSAAGVNVSDALGTGGWQGASYTSGPNADDTNVSPNTSTVTATLNGVTFRAFRNNYPGGSGAITTA